jgi:HlyD family secretion protein
MGCILTKVRNLYEYKILMNMKKYFRIIIAALIALLFLGTFVYLYQRSKPKEEKYEELTATRKSLERTTLINGSIEPRNEVNIKPQISGIIAELYKEPGQNVTAGEIIAKVNVIPEMSSLSSAQSRVRLAEINRKQAKTDFEREKALYDKKLVSADEYDKIAQAYEQAKEEYDAAVDALEVVRTGVSKQNASSSSTLIRSTITGLILDVPVKVGNSVIQANTFNDGTTIATVADMKDLIFDGRIDETEVGKIQEGTNVEITIGALQDQKFEATLEYISPKATDNNGTKVFEIKAAVKPQEGSMIRSGYSANAKVILDHADSVVTIPEKALEFSGDSTFVYLMGKDSTYKRTPVTIGLSDGVDVEIKNGLKSGDKVRGNKIIETKK